MVVTKKTAFCNICLHFCGREARDFWCPVPVWNLRKAIWFPLSANGPFSFFVFVFQKVLRHFSWRVRYHISVSLTGQFQGHSGSGKMKLKVVFEKLLLPFKLKVCVIVASVKATMNIMLWVTLVLRHGRKISVRIAASKHNHNVGISPGCDSKISCTRCTCYVDDDDDSVWNFTHCKSHTRGKSLCSNHSKNSELLPTLHFPLWWKMAGGNVVKWTRRA